MEHVGKEKSPYHGVLLSSLLLISVQVLLFLLFKYVIMKYQDFEKDFNTYSAMVIGFGVGFIFQFSCVFAGLTKGTLSVVVRRVANLFDDLSISVKYAFKCYFADIKENGIVFWIYFIIVTSTIAASIIGAIYLFNNYASYFM
jgi:hypothetical protein